MLRGVPNISKADFYTLAKEFGSIRNILQAQQQRLLLCPGFGPKKVRSLLATFDEPFFDEAVIEELSTCSSESSSLWERATNLGYDLVKE